MRLLKSSLTKKLLGVVLILGCSGVFLNGYVGVGEVHAAVDGGVITAADGTTSSGSMSTMGLLELLNMMLKLIYLLLWPLLVVAGLALDNTLVYGSIFHLDAPLWKFWNMMKNFANFTLGFMVLFAIIKNLFMPKDEKGPIDIIKKTLIAGVLIQASRFLMAAVVDVSTIATYAVGGLPLSVLKNTDIGKQKILGVHSELNLNKFDLLNTKSQGFKVWYTTSYKDANNTIKKVEFSPCRIEKKYIVGREYTDAQYRNSDIFGIGQSACVAFGNQIVIYNEFPNTTGVNGAAYQGELNRILNFQTDWGPREACDYIIKVGGKSANLGACGTGMLAIHDKYLKENKDIVYGSMEEDDTKDCMLPVTKYIPTNTKSDTLGMKGGTTWFGSGNVIAMTISDLINKSKGFVGPLVTMYSSLLNFTQLADTNVTSIGENSGIFIIKTGIAVALFFPLLALAIVLIARIGLLWLYIAASPFLVIKKVFTDFIPKEALGSLDKHLDIGNVFKLIFAPVITVAALSLSLIFMTALINGFKSDDNTQISKDVSRSFKMESIPNKNGNTTLRIANTSELEFTNFDRGGSLDRFSWLVVNFFAIGLLWTILFSAIKANELGAVIGKEVQKFGSGVFQSMPILPFGKDGKVGIGSAWKEATARPQEWIDQRERNQRNDIYEKYFKKPDETKEPTTITETNAKTIISNGGTTQAKIEAEMAKLGVKKENISAVLTSSAEAIYAAIQAQPTDRDTTRDAFFNAGLDKDTYNKIVNTAVAKAALDAITTVATNQANLEPIITANTTALETYFTATGGTTYETTIKDGKTYIVTKTTSGNTITYPVTEKPQ